MAATNTGPADVAMLGLVYESAGPLHTFQVGSITIATHVILEVCAAVFGVLTHIGHRCLHDVFISCRPNGFRLANGTGNTNFRPAVGPGHTRILCKRVEGWRTTYLEALVEDERCLWLGESRPSLHTSSHSLRDW